MNKAGSRAAASRKSGNIVDNRFRWSSTWDGDVRNARSCGVIAIPGRQVKN